MQEVIICVGQKERMTKGIKQTLKYQWTTTRKEE